MRQIFELLLLFSIAACGNSTQTTNAQNAKTSPIKRDITHYSASQKDKQISDYNKLLKSIIIGKWQLATDRKDITVITKDFMTQIYKGKTTSSNPIIFSFEGSSHKYYKAKNTFDFSSVFVANNSVNNEINNSFKIKEIDSKTSDTSNLTIIYVDSSNLELGFSTGAASFKRIE